jgi:predicted nucleic acid-binding protein
MVMALLDTNILIDYLNGVPQAKKELARYRERAISVVTWMEVMVGVQPEVEVATRTFLSGFRRIGVDDAVALRAVELRRAYRVKLPDAIIWASAQCHGLLLVTRNIKDFPKDEPGVRMPYSV